MKIAATQYSINTKSLDIYFSGCTEPHCRGCHNSELWDFTIGDSIEGNIIKSISKKIIDFDSMIDSIFLLGGEPLDQDINMLSVILMYLKKEFPEIKIWLFTKYKLSEVPEKIKYYCDFIKTGRYDEEKLVSDNMQYGILLASSNQNIYEKGEF